MSQLRRAGASLRHLSVSTVSIPLCAARHSRLNGFAPATTMFNFHTSMLSSASLWLFRSAAVKIDMVFLPLLSVRTIRALRPDTTTITGQGRAWSANRKCTDQEECSLPVSRRTTKESRRYPPLFRGLVRCAQPSLRMRYCPFIKGHAQGKLEITRLREYPICFAVFPGSTITDAHAFPSCQIVLNGFRMLHKIAII